MLGRLAAWRTHGTKAGQLRCEQPLLLAEVQGSYPCPPKPPQTVRTQPTQDSSATATVCCKVSSAVAELVTLRSVGSRTVAPKPALKFPNLKRPGQRGALAALLEKAHIGAPIKMKVRPTPMLTPKGHRGRSWLAVALGVQGASPRGPQGAKLGIWSSAAVTVPPSIPTRIAEKPPMVRITPGIRMLSLTLGVGARGKTLATGRHESTTSGGRLICSSSAQAMS